MIAIYNPEKNVFLSPIAEDSAAKFIESPLGQSGRTVGPGDDGYRNDTMDTEAPHIETVSQFGRDFSVVSIPYALKLLLQELQAMNVVLRLITEDNIHQMSNLAYRTLVPDPSNNTFVKQYIKKTQAALRGETVVASPTEDSMAGEATTLKKLVLPRKELEEEEEEEPAFRPASPFRPFRPDSPDYPPPASTEVLTGGGGVASSFVIDELVRYIGDNKPSRIWVVHGIAPATNMVTIETDDTEGLADSDTIRVIVNPEKQLYRIPLPSLQPGGEGGVRIPWANPEMGGGSGMGGGGGIPQGIVFAPNIHVGNTFGPTPDASMMSADMMMSGGAGAPMPMMPPSMPMMLPPFSPKSSSSSTSSQKSESGGSGGGGILQSIMDLGKSFTVRKSE
jgi:hypothetical protein